jgi:hypothetical protein
LGIGNNRAGHTIGFKTAESNGQTSGQKSKSHMDAEGRRHERFNFMRRGEPGKIAYIQYGDGLKIGSSNRNMSFLNKISLRHCLLAHGLHLRLIDALGQVIHISYMPVAFPQSWKMGYLLDTSQPSAKRLPNVAR